MTTRSVGPERGSAQDGPSNASEFPGQDTDMEWKRAGRIGLSLRMRIRLATPVPGVDFPPPNGTDGLTQRIMCLSWVTYTFAPMYLPNGGPCVLTQISAKTQPAGDVSFRRPDAADGAPVHQLIARCPPLEHNSLYCNLLQCTHFADTCVVACQDGVPVGFLSGYLIPKQPEKLFIWQIAVAAEARNRGIGGRMIMDVLGRPTSAGVRYLKTTITESNEQSWSLFEALARKLRAPLERQLLFDRQRHLAGSADSEILATIGPFSRPA